MRDLDKKVFGRDSVFIAVEDQPMGGWLSNAFKKVKKIAKSVVPKKIYNQLKGFERRNRKEIKKLGAVAAVGTIGYFAGPSILSAAKSLGGSSIVKAATGKTAKQLVQNAIRAKLTPRQVKQMKQDAQTMSPMQVMTDPRYTQVADYAAQYAANQQYRNEPPPKRAAARLLAKEGSVEVSHQTEKAMPFMEKYGKYAIPAVGTVLATMLMRH
jgi:hypothetical protein